MPQYSKKLKQDLLKETDNKCFYCGISLEGGYEIEHVIPRSLRGSGTRRNLTVSCRKCNIIKLDYSIEKFKEIIKIEEFYFQKIGLLKGEIRGKSVY